MKSFAATNKSCEIPKFKSIEDIKILISDGGYVHDNIGNVIKDYLIHPRVIQCRLSNKSALGDCDDHAIYWCTAIKKSDLAKKVWFSFFSMKEKEKNPRYSAHAVCVFLGKDDKFYWCDYYLPRIIEKPEDFQIDSANLYKNEAICGAMWEVVALESDDTPIFGDLKTVLPRKK
jgi:hypothetical protein